MVIEKAEFRDLESLTRIYSDSAEALGKDDIDWIRAVLKSNSKRIIAIVAKYDGAVVGFAIAYRNGKRAYIDSIAVDKNYRGMGIGRAILEYLEKIFLEKRVKLVFLSVKSWNVRALDFYLRNGYGVKSVVLILRANPSEIRAEQLDDYVIEVVEAGLVKWRRVKPTVQWCNLVDNVDMTIYRKLYKTEKALITKKSGKTRAIAIYSINDDLTVDSIYLSSYNNDEDLVVLLNALKQIALHSRAKAVEIPVDATKKNLVRILEECGFKVSEAEYLLYKDLSSSK
ncbi:MAG: GNAT family N-acetyltransferase [Desulfurococcaceae archaeon]